MREHRQVAVGEGRLVAGDRVQGDVGIGDDPRAVFAGDLAVFFQPVRLQPFARHAGCGWADLVLGFKLDSLGFQGAVVDPRLDAQLGQALVDMGGPGFAPMLQLLGAVPLPHLGAEAVLIYRAHGQHDMGVRLELAVRADVPMDVEIGNHAAIHELGLDEVAGQFDALFLCQFARDGELHLAGKLSILALLGGLDRIPETLALPKLIGSILRRHHLRMDDAALVGEVMVTVQPLIVKPGCRTIGGRGQRARTVGAADDLRGEMVDRHDGLHTLPSARRHDV